MSDGEISFEVETWQARARVIVYVRSSLEPGFVYRFEGKTEDLAMRHARAFMEEQRARQDRKGWGIRRRWAGRIRQAALEIVAKGWRP